jgi:uncharacterized membrane protein YgaE (UPF0421/DUF939 family)
VTILSQDRFLGLAVVALLGTMGGELFGVDPLVTLGVTGFFVAVAGLLATMTLALIVGVSRTANPDMLDSPIVDRAH